MMKRTRRPSWPRGKGARDERGSILIPVAVCLLGLLTFSAFTIDQGVMLSSRRQAQNSADAGALAAALYLAWDDPAGQAGAQAMGVAAAQVNEVWGSAPDVTLTDVTFLPCPPGAPGLVDLCVRVDVYRNQGRNPLPAFFASLAGVTEQGVRATATAQVVYGSSASCLLPFAIPDRFELREEEGTESAGGLPDAIDDSTSPTANYPDDEGDGDAWDVVGDTFDIVETQGQQGGNPLNGITDDYVPGSQAVGGSGFDSYRDHGIRFVFRPQVQSEISPSFWFPIVLSGPGSINTQRDIMNCGDTEVEVGDLLAQEPGFAAGPIRRGINHLVSLDSNAIWDSSHLNPDGTYGNISGGCLADQSCGRSPRWRAVPVFDIRNYMTGHRTGRGDIVVTSFVGMWVEGMDGNNVAGNITTFDFDPGAGNFTNDTSSFLRNVILVR